MSASELDQPLRLRQDRVMWRQVGDEVIALTLERSEYLAPSESATELWKMLADGTTLRQLAAALIDRWRLEEKQATRDAAAFVLDLREQGLIEATEMPS